MDEKLRYAGFWRRLQAWIIDFALVMISTMIIAMIAALILIGFFSIVHIDKTIANRVYDLTGIVVGAVVFVAYFAGLESSKFQATPGKVLLDIIVTDMNGERIGFWTALARLASKILSGFLFFLGFIIADFTTHKQALHDIIAQTLVLRKSKES